MYKALNFEVFLLINSPFADVTICTANIPASDFRHILIPNEKVKGL